MKYIHKLIISITLVLVILFWGSVILILWGGLKYSPENHGYIGRSVVAEFGGGRISLARFGKQFLFLDKMYNDLNFPYFIDYYYIYSDNGVEKLYLICKDNLAVVNQKGECDIFYSVDNIESKRLIRYLIKFYKLTDNNVVDDINKLELKAKAIYLNRPSMN